MIRPIMTRRFFLRQPSEQAGPDDLAIAQDLVDTLEANRERCIGLAANMIGQLKRIIAVRDEHGGVLVMLNPVVTKAHEPYEAVEGCLSLKGLRSTTTRYRRITVAYDDLSMQPHEESFSDRVAQIIQHEVDHCNGVVV
ncbi:MAG: peptide deformylase [Coriobacteriales bacterium]|nr:peptide deformylase [Coriobacteriales bacterium]